MTDNGTRNIQLKPDELIFHEGDQAKSLFVIRSGMIRLFSSKGKGRVEIAVLHSGEIFGEMAFFEEGKGRRSCSAEAIVSATISEIDFTAFEKMCRSLNPWFQTLVNTLISRLNKCNMELRQFQDNSVATDYSGGTGTGFKFLKDIDIVRLFSIFYLNSKDHEADNETVINEDLLEYFSEDIFSISESRFLQFLEMLKGLDIVELQKNAKGEMRDVHVKDIASIKSSLLFLNSQRHLLEDKKMQIPHNCVLVFDGVIKKDNVVPYGVDVATVNLQTILEDLKENGVTVDNSDFTNAIKHNLMEDPYLDNENNLVARINIPLIRKLLPSLRVMAALKELNYSKSTK